MQRPVEGRRRHAFLPSRRTARTIGELHRPSVAEHRHAPPELHWDQLIGSRGIVCTRCRSARCHGGVDRARELGPVNAPEDITDPCGDRPCTRAAVRRRACGRPSPPVRRSVRPGQLLAQLLWTGHLEGLVRGVRRVHVPLRVDTIVRMGDTLTHLVDLDDVQAPSSWAQASDSRTVWQWPTY